LSRDETLEQIRQKCLQRVPAPRPTWVIDGVPAPVAAS
jgi:hypothetical protein